MVCLHSTPKELILLKNENVSFYPLQLSDTSALLLSAQSSLSILAQKYLDKCEDTYFILQKKYYLCIYKDSFGAKILWDDCAHSEMGKNYFTCSFLIFSIVSDNLRKKFLSIIKKLTLVFILFEWERDMGLFFKVDKNSASKNVSFLSFLYVWYNEEV